MLPSLSPLDILPDPERTLLLVVDVQERLAVAMPAEQLPGVLRNTTILIEAAKAFQIPILVSEQYPKGLGNTVAEVKAALPTEVQPVPKIAFSCWREPALQEALQALDNRNVILCGMETHICVLQTALDLLSQGRRVYVAADAVCSRAGFNLQLGVDLLRQAGAVIGSTEMLAFGLLRQAGSERFKLISKLVK